MRGKDNHFWSEEEICFEEAANSGDLDLVSALRLAISNPMVLKAALTSAATEGHLAIVTALLDSGAEQDARDTALRVAARDGHTAIVRLLLVS